MNVLSHKQELVFANHPHPDADGNPVGGYGDTVTVSPKSTLQEVPDWIRETETFKHAEKAGLILVVKVDKPTVPADAPVPEPPIIPEAAQNDEQPEEVAGLSSNSGRRKK